MHSLTRIFLAVGICLTILVLFIGVEKAQANSSGGLSVKEPSRIQKVTLTKNDKARVPTDAPKRVKMVIRAANRISHTPYEWGGGHGGWQSYGYDCSGSVSYALHGGKLLFQPLTSGSLAEYGKMGRGKWITIYANGGHTWMKFRGGIKFDTSGANPSRWQIAKGTSTVGYSIRHPKGL